MIKNRLKNKVLTKYESINDSEFKINSILKFNDAGNIISEYLINENIIIKYDYTKSNKLSLVQNIDISNIKQYKETKDRTTYIYDENDNLVEAIDYENSEKTIKSIYNSDKIIKSIEYFDPKSPDTFKKYIMEKSKKNENVYEDKDDMIAIEYNPINNNIIKLINNKDKKSKYVFGDNDKLILKTYEENGKEIKTVYEYNDEGLLSSKTINENNKNCDVYNYKYITHVKFH